MRRAKGTLRGWQCTGLREACYGLNRYDLERLVLRQCGQDSRHATREHCFAATRWTHHQQRVAAGRGDFGGALGIVLPDHFSEIDAVTCNVLVRLHPRKLGPLVMAQSVDNFRERPYRGDTRAFHKRRFGDIRRRNQKQPHTWRAPYVPRDGEHAAHRADCAIKPKLSDGQNSIETSSVDLTCGGEHCQRDWDVEAGPVFPHVGRSQVHSEAFGWQHKAGMD
jgi:hypothetical protein